MESDRCQWIVLVVEDEYDSLQVVLQVLQHHGIRVHSAHDGQECLNVVETIHPTLIITDLAMPKLDGWQTLAKLRSNPSTAHIPVLAMTAYHSVSVAEDALEAGFDAYFPKPIDPATFVESLSRFVAPSAAGPQAA
jgi:CheY-like chemotaxis protein